MIVVRYADDSVVGFEAEADASRFLEALKARFAQFGLSLNEQKTRVLQFGRYAASQRKRAGLGRPQTFDFYLARTRLSGPTSGFGVGRDIGWTRGLCGRCRACFFGNRLSTTTVYTRRDAGRVSSRPSGSLRRALRQLPSHPYPGTPRQTCAKSSRWRTRHRRSLTPPDLCRFTSPSTHDGSPFELIWDGTA